MTLFRSELEDSAVQALANLFVLQTEQHGIVDVHPGQRIESRGRQENLVAVVDAALSRESRGVALVVVLKPALPSAPLAPTVPPLEKHSSQPEALLPTNPSRTIHRRKERHRLRCVGLRLANDWGLTDGKRRRGGAVHPVSPQKVRFRRFAKPINSLLEMSTYSLPSRQWDLSGIRRQCSVCTATNNITMPTSTQLHTVSPRPCHDTPCTVRCC